MIAPAGESLRASPIDLGRADRPVWAGRDAEGRFHVLIARDRAGRGARGPSLRRVQIWVTNRLDSGVSRTFLDVVCLIPELVRLFEDIVADMLERIAVDDGDPAVICATELNRWRALLERPRSDRLSLSDEVGLFGELIVALEIARLSARSIPLRWTGPSSATVDFLSDTTAIEVKTTTRREGRIVEIHGVEQLEPPSGRDLFLEWVRVVESPEGRSIADLVVEMTDLGVRRLELLEALGRRGYEERMAHGVSCGLFEVVERRMYTVDDAFPRIIKSSFIGSAMPPGTMMLRYQVDLTGRSPVPLTDHDARLVYERIA